MGEFYRTLVLVGGLCLTADWMAHCRLAEANQLLLLLDSIPALTLGRQALAVLPYKLDMHQVRVTMLHNFHKNIVNWQGRLLVLLDIR